MGWHVTDPRSAQLLGAIKSLPSVQSGRDHRTGTSGRLPAHRRPHHRRHRLRPSPPWSTAAPAKGVRPAARDRRVHGGAGVRRTRAPGAGGGEVGRGTFVRAAASAGPYGRALIEPSTAAPVNLELNYPSAPGQSELLAPALAPLLRPDVLTEALRPAPATGTAAAREAVADLLATPAWRPAPGRILFTGNARQAIAATLASLVRPGGRVGVEPLTYPLVREIAGRLGVTLVALEADGGGLCPESVRAAHRAGPLSALYLQPTLHNPTSVTTGEARKREIGDVVRELGLPVVEDRIWSFLHPDSPPRSPPTRPTSCMSWTGCRSGSRRGSPSASSSHRKGGWTRWPARSGRVGGVRGGSRWRPGCGGRRTGPWRGWSRPSGPMRGPDSGWSPRSWRGSPYGPIRSPTTRGGSFPRHGGPTRSRPPPRTTASRSPREPRSAPTRNEPRTRSDSASRQLPSPPCAEHYGRWPL